MFIQEKGIDSRRSRDLETSWWLRGVRLRDNNHKAEEGLIAEGRTTTIGRERLMAEGRMLSRSRSRSRPLSV